MYPMASLIFNFIKGIGIVKLSLFYHVDQQIKNKSMKKCEKCNEALLTFWLRLFFFRDEAHSHGSNIITNRAQPSDAIENECSSIGMIERKDNSCWGSCAFDAFSCNAREICQKAMAFICRKCLAGRSQQFGQNLA